VSPPIFEPLGPQHDRAAFSCGDEALDRYLRQQATQDTRNWVAAPFVLRDPESPRIIGYYTLSTFSIELRDLPTELARRLPRYPRLPAVLIGRLAVDREFNGKGWGGVLLLDALRRSLEQTRQIAAMAVVVEAKNDRARAFYEKYGFVQFSGHEYRLFLPMGTVEQLLSA